MFTLFIAVAVLKDFEALDGTINMLNKNTILGKVPVKLLLQICKFALMRLLKRCKAELM